VVIGVDEAGAGIRLPGLRFAESDARSVAEVLSDPDIGVFQPGDVELFAGGEATACAIKGALSRAVIGSGPGDLLLIYFAGHAMTPDWSLGTDRYLVTAGLDEEALVEDPDSGLRMAFLRRDVLDAFAGTALLVLDCCHAGHLLHTPGRPVELVSFDGRGEPRYSALTGGGAGSAAREDDALAHGVLTGRLLDALRGGAADDQGRVTFEGAGEYVRERVPGVALRTYGPPAVLTRQAVGTPIPDISEISVFELETPLEPAASAITALIGELARHARPPGPAHAAEPTLVSRVEYVRAAFEAEAVGFLEQTSAGFRAIDATTRFDVDVLRPILGCAATSTCFGHVATDGGRRVLTVPLRHVDGKSQLVAVVDPAPALLEIGQPVAKIVETVWRADFAGAPDEAEIHVLTALRDTFGRLPAPLFDRCLSLYRDVLESFSMVFQPIVTIGKIARHVGVHSYEALARRSPTDQRAPIALLEVARVWGDHFMLARDEIILRKAVRAYARAHAESPFADPLPVSINVAVRSLLSDQYVAAIREAVAAAHLDPAAVTLEISEQDPIEPRAGEQWSDEPHAYFHKRLAAISRDLGVAFAVDDFGTGFATLSRMAELPLTQIKVDRAILHHPLAEDELRLVVKTARYHRDRGDAHDARVVIVEGVDDASPLTLKQIFDQGIKHVQGYIARQPAAPTLSPLPSEIREDIAARVRGGHDNRPSVVTRRSESPLRRTA
jgi:EAL domain-containing protein (putative c-di-GMP-specific phosphodiesterase class I)